MHEQNLYKAVSGDDDSAADLLRIGNSDGNRNANVKMLIPFYSRSFPFPSRQHLRSHSRGNPKGPTASQ